jgi:hypothetical protein
MPGSWRNGRIFDGNLAETTSMSGDQKYEVSKNQASDRYDVRLGGVFVYSSHNRSDCEHFIHGKTTPVLSPAKAEELRRKMSEHRLREQLAGAVEVSGKEAVA